MSKSKNIFSAASLTMGQLNAIVKKLGGPEGALNFLRGTTPSKWVQEDNVIYLSVTSDGTTVEQWIKKFQTELRISTYAQSALRASSLIPTNGITYDLEILKGSLWSDQERTTKAITQEAKIRGLELPNSEVACLIRDQFSDEQFRAMGLYWLVVMHKPTLDHTGELVFLTPRCCGLGSWLSVQKATSSKKYQWGRAHGFVFVRSKTLNLTYC